MAEYAGGARPMTGSRRPPTSARLGTAVRTSYGRLGTAAARGANTQGVLSNSIKVSDRPMTQAGLGGTSGVAKGPGRSVQDESYWLGSLRQKSNELQQEIAKIRKSIEKQERDHASFGTFEKKAEVLAAEIKELQGQLGDLNVLQDKLNTNTEIDEVDMDREDIKARNDREAQDIDAIFSERRKVEEEMKHIESEINSEKNVEETLVDQMTSAQRKQYTQLKQATQEMQERAKTMQAEYEEISNQVSGMERELRANPIKEDAVGLYDQIHALEQKRDSLQQELDASSQRTPEQEREALLAEVKSNNQDIAAMDRKINDFQNEIRDVQEKLNDLEDDEADPNDPKRQKYLELVKKDEEMQKFLDEFATNRNSETSRIEQAEAKILVLLEHVSRSISRSTALPSVSEHNTIKDEFSFKQHEMEKSKSTSENLDVKRDQLAKDLRNVNTLEEKIEKELATKKAEIAKMEEELVKYGDLDGLAMDTESQKRKLAEDKKRLAVRKDVMKMMMQQHAAQYERLKNEMNDNETHVQLLNLEKKWQHHEKNNFAMKEFIATKEREADFSDIASKVTDLVQEYNEILKSR